MPELSSARRAPALENVLAGFAQGAGRSAVVVLVGGRKSKILCPDAPLAVDSACKLAVDAALKQQFELVERSRH
jgi:hypothetical protein